MVKASDNQFPSVLFAEQGSTPTTPAAGLARIYCKVDGVYIVDDAGVAVRISGGAEVDYVEFTSDVSVTATTEGTANTVVTGSSITYDGSTVIVIEFFSPGLTCQATTGASLTILLYDGATILGYIAGARTPAASNNRYPTLGRRRLTPSAAAHQYICKAMTSSGTGTVIGEAGGTGNYLPGYIRITRA